jgi:hypothetical protein
LISQYPNLKIHDTDTIVARSSAALRLKEIQKLIAVMWRKTIHGESKGWEGDEDVDVDVGERLSEVLDAGMDHHHHPLPQHLDSRAPYL